MKHRPEIGVHLREAAPLIEVIKFLMVEDFELINPEVALPDRDRVTVYLVNHGSFIAPTVAPALTVEYVLQQGGYDDLVAVTLFHWIAEYIPGLSPIFVKFFGHSTRKLRSLPGLVEMMRAKRFQVIGTAPEGVSSIFIYDEPIGPLTKGGLIVAALEADADIVLAVQKGMEVFGRPVVLPLGATFPVEGLFPYLKQPRGMLLPVWNRRRRARLRVKYARYEPLVPYSERSESSRRERRKLNGEEIERIRQQMIDLYRSM